MSERKLLQEGWDPECPHEHEAPSGHGTVCYFTECVRCRAKFSYSTGHDADLAALEASREPVG